MLRYTVLCFATYAMLCNVVLLHADYAMLRCLRRACHLVLRYVLFVGTFVTCYVMFRSAVPRYAVLFVVMFGFAVLYDAMLRYAMLSGAVLRHAMSW